MVFDFVFIDLNLKKIIPNDNAWTEIRHSFH